MDSKEQLRGTWNPAVTHINAAIDGLLAPLRGPDGNCRRFDLSNPAERAVADAVAALAEVRDKHLDRLERLTR